MFFLVACVIGSHAVANCMPTYMGADNSEDTALTICEGGSAIQGNPLDFRDRLVNWPVDGIVRGSVLFQIRSCGGQFCNNATKFGITGKAAVLRNKNSKIPLTVTFTQASAPGRPSVTLPQTRPCNNGGRRCPFYGAGLQNGQVCNNCLYFELTFSANLNKVSALEPGQYRGVVEFTIDQAEKSASGSNDSDHEKTVRLLITLDSQEQLQISGLKDLAFTDDTQVNNGEYQIEQPFCVYRMGGGTFSITATGGHDTGGQFNLYNNQKMIRYRLDITRKTQFGNFYVPFSPGVKESRWYWYGDCPKADENPGNESNMKLRISINKNAADNLPGGVYMDTMTLTVSAQ